MLGSIVRRGANVLFCWSSSWARMKVSSATIAGTAISIQSARSFVVSAVAGANAPAQPERSGDALTLCRLSFPKARRPLIGRIAQHRPNRGGLPTRDLLARRNTALIELTRDRTNTHASTDIALVDHPHDSGFGIEDFISGGCVVALANVTITVRRAAENVDLSLAGAMALAAARSFKDLCFAEVRRHLGVETQRQWSEPAIARTTPILLGLFSLITLWANEAYTTRTPAARIASWYRKSLPTFSDALASVRRQLWATGNLSGSRQMLDPTKIPSTQLSRLRKFGFTERYRFDSLTSSIRWRTWTDAWCRPSDCCDVQLP